MDNMILLQLQGILPELVIAVTAIFSLLLAAYGGSCKARSATFFSIFGLVLASVIQVRLIAMSGTLFNGLIMLNLFTHSAKILIMLSSAVILILLHAYYRDKNNYYMPEYPFFILCSVIGMMITVSANHFLTVYMGLELQSLAFYVLAAWHRHHARSSEAGLKYFILGSLASGILLLGCAYIYGFSGTLDFTKLVQALGEERISIGILVGLVLVLIAIFFKLSAAPFHMWTPDVYQGAPTIVTALFASSPKIAILGLLLRILQGPFVHSIEQWQQIIGFMALVSMMVGALGAIRQYNIKRLLAYSSIGHMGYILLGVMVGIEGVQAVATYIALYITMTLGMFGIVLMMQDKDGDHMDISMLSGLSKQRPLIAASIAILLLSMAGIPPMAGFIGKFYVFKAAIAQHFYFLAVAGVLSSVIAAFYYLRIIKMMYFDDSKELHMNTTSLPLKLVVYSAVIFNLFFILYFSPFVQWCEQLKTAMASSVMVSGLF